MKKILLLSDTHSYLDDAIKIHASAADEIWHAGDIGSLALADSLNSIKPLRAVYGNIDDYKVRSAWPEQQHFICEGLRIWITHIGGHPGNYANGISQRLLEYSPDIFICGHSHLLRVMRDVKHKLLYINPGAAGVHGFHHMRTMIRFTLNMSKVENVEVIELGLRGKLP